MSCSGAEAAAGAPRQATNPLLLRDAFVAHRQHYSGCLIGPDIAEDLSGRAERLLQQLEEFTGAKVTSEIPLPVEFKITLQVAEHMAQQGALLHMVNNKLEDFRAELIEHIGTVRGSALDENGKTAHLPTMASGSGELVMNGKGNGIDVAVEAKGECGDVYGDGATQHHATDVDHEEGGLHHEGHAFAQIGSRQMQAAQMAQQLRSQSGTIMVGPALNADMDKSVKWATDAISHRQSLVLDDIELQDASADPPKSQDSEGAVGSTGIQSSRHSSPGSRSRNLMEHVALVSSRESQEDFWMRSIVSSSQFETACAFVIVCNAITIGISAQESIQHAIKYPGETLTKKDPVIQILNLTYISFYSAELLLKLCVFRCSFFCGENRRWNLFDALLVLAGFYDVMILLLGGSGAMNLTGLRVLRIVKTLKLLRVIKVMRFFQVLRLMVSSISGSMTTLFWSVLMISIMIYMFALCFLQAVVGYLNDHKRQDIDPTDMDYIKVYWSSVEQGMMTLFWAVTGGADWEQIAMPIRSADPFFYALFFFYIAFAAFAVLNVLTGMFVDAAMKVSQQDEEDVAGELASRKEITEFRNFVNSRASTHPGTITWNMIEKSQDERFINFQKLLEIDIKECERVFKLMDSDCIGEVDVEEYISACCRCNGSVSGLDMVFLLTQTKQIHKQLTVSMAYVEDRFNEIFESSCGKKTAVQSLGCRLEREDIRKTSKHVSRFDSKTF